MSKSQLVEPIKSLADIEKIKRHLLRQKQHRNYALFVCGINLGLRVGDLLNLKIEDMWQGGGFKEELIIKEQKTGKIRHIKLNSAVKEAVSLYLNSLKCYNETEWLFPSRQGNQPLSRKTAHQLINKWVEECHIKGNYGTHSLRKTFSYQLYMANAENPMILPYLMKLLNHSTQTMTLRYIGLEKETLSGLVDSLNL